MSNSIFEQPRELPWRIIGKSFDSPVSVGEALRESGADFTVTSRPVAVLTPDIEEKLRAGKTVTARELRNCVARQYSGNVRTDNGTCLGIVSPSYGIVQNREAFSFIDMLCSGNTSGREHPPVIETAGVLGYGQRIFVSARFPEEIALGSNRDDLLKLYIVFTTTHDGTGGITGMVTPVRVWCNNTLNLAFRNHRSKFTLRHSREAAGRLDLTKAENADFVYKSLKIYDVYTDTLRAKLDHLANIRLAEKDIERIVGGLTFTDEEMERWRKTGYMSQIPISKASSERFRRLCDCLETGLGQHGQEKGSGLWLLNGVTTYSQNLADYKSPSSMFDSITVGTAHQRMQKAYELIEACQNA